MVVTNLLINILRGIADIRRVKLDFSQFCALGVFVLAYFLFLVRVHLSGLVLINNYISSMESWHFRIII